MAEDNVEASEKSDYSLPPLETDANKSDDEQIMNNNLMQDKKPPHLALVASIHRAISQAGPHQSERNPARSREEAH